MKLHGFFAFVFASLFISIQARAETFDFTSGTHVWNVATNWTPDTVPDSNLAAAIIPAATGHLTIDLGEDITVNTLTINKPANTAATTTITSSGFALTFDGATRTLTHPITAGSSDTIIDVPVVISTSMTVSQSNNNPIIFNKIISGGNLTLNRPGAGQARTITLAAANTYTGTTTLAGGTNNPLLLRLNHADALTSTSTISASHTIIELAAGNFTRGITFTGSNINGFGAIGANRFVRINNDNVNSLAWSSLTPGTFVLGNANSTATTILENPILVDGGAARVISVSDGTAAIDGQITGSLSGSQTLQKNDAGTLSLAADNSAFSGNTFISSGILRLDHANALGSGNLQLSNGATLGIGADTTVAAGTDFVRELGSGAGQIQLISTGSGGNNQANSGFFATGANRTVSLLTPNLDNEVIWGAGSFLSNSSGAASLNFIVSDNNADATVTFTNPIDLGAGNVNPSLTGSPTTRNVVVRNGSADIDAVLPGVLRGTSSLTKDNTGTLVLSGNNTYSGGTVVVSGRLLVNNSPAMAGDSGTGTGNVTLSGTSILGGTGTIAGMVMADVGSAATIAPGNSVGTLGTGAVSLVSGSTFHYELDSTTPATPLADLLNVNGALSLNGATLAGIDLADPDMTLDPGTKLTLISYAGAWDSTTFAGLADGAPVTIGANTFSINYDDTTAGENGGLYSSFVTLEIAPTNNADFNGDGIIDAADYAVWAKFNGATGTGTQSTGDADGDTNVDNTDYDIWAGTFGDMPGSGSGGAVPEPATWTLLGMAALFVSRRRRRWLSA